MKKLLLSAACIASAFALAGCLDGGKGGAFPTINKSPSGGGGGGGFIVAPTAPAGKMDIEMADDLTSGNGAITSINAMFNPDTGPASVTAGAWAGLFNPPTLQGYAPAAGFESCITYSGGDIDADKDDIPKKMSINFNCANVIDNDSKFSITGSYVFEDENDNKAFPEAGYIMTYDNFSYKFSGGDSPYYFNNILNGYFKYNVVGRTSKMEVQFENNMDTDVPNHETGLFGHYANSSITPDASGTSGRLEFKGFYRDTVNLNITLEYYSKNLTYDHSCSGFYKDGSITYVDGSSNKIVYTFNNCTETVTFNGQSI